MEPDENVEHTSVEQLDLQELRDLLGLLKEMKVKVFSMGNLSVGFQEEEQVRPYSVKSLRASQDGDEEDEGTQIQGFKHLEGTFKDPKLWREQGGKPFYFTKE